MSRKDKVFVCFLIILFALTIIYGFLHYLINLSAFWKITFEKLIGLFSTLVVGVSSIYITVMLNAKNNTYKKKIEFLEEQIKKLFYHFENDFNDFGKVPMKISYQESLYKIRKISDIIFRIEKINDILKNNKVLNKKHQKIDKFFKILEEINKNFNEYQDIVEKWFINRKNFYNELKNIKSSILVLSNTLLIEIIRMY